MAVFPDRIVLKNSADDQATIEAAIQAGGSDEITQGEIVLGIETAGVKFYTKAGDGSIVTLGGTEGLGLQAVVDDTSPQLGGNLDVNGFDIVSLAGAVDIGSANGELVVRGGSSEGKLTLNCTANTHGVSIQSPPHSSGATYVLTLPDDTGTSGQSLTTDGTGSLSWATPSAVGSIDDLSDVDTSSVAPTDGQVLTWSASDSEWVPATTDTGGATTLNDLTDVDTATAPPSDGQVLVWSATDSEWVPGNQTGGGSGGGGSSAARLVESQVAAGGLATFVGIGHSGTLVDVASSLDAWVVFYDSEASRTADAGRAYIADPSPGSGVLAELYIAAGNTVLATPGTTYFNNDGSVTEAIYAAIRDQAGSGVNSDVTVTAYGNQTITSVSGGTFGSGV